MENQPEKPLPPQEEPQGSFSQCFKFASAQDFFILFSGLFLAFLNGAGISAFGLVIGLAVSTFDVRYTEDQVREYAKEVTFYFFALGVTIFIGTFGSRTLLRINAQRQGFKIRRAYLQALLHKEPSFFDKTNPMEVSSQVENDCKAVVDSLDVQIESIVFTIGALACGVFSAFIRSWQISLMVMAAVPLILGSVLLYQHYTIRAAEQRSAAYGRAGGIAEEALTNIRTVVSLGGERDEVKRYDGAVKTIQEMLSKTGIYQGLSFGFGEFLFPMIVGVVFYIGSYYIENGTINPTTGNAYLAADLFTPVSAIATSFSQLPVVSASLKGINFAKVKIKKILDVVESVKVEEDPSKKSIKDFKGAITFKNVSFAYPVNPEKVVLQNLSVNIKPNMKIAFVGESGSGKSTIIQLLQKFYDPLSGTIEFDGQDLRTLNTSWMRKNVAYVGQEPVLFSMTIRQNLLLAKEDATEDELVQSLKKANAYNFVMDMDQKMDTVIGGGVGAQLSGGQKQRIAIARAILKDSRILLLDEATSALDRLSEKEIQATLDNISGDRTIIIIAHRLSTIQAADQIIVLDKGNVVEIGTHMELLSKEGKYFDLQAAQAGIETRKDLPTELAIKNKPVSQPEIKNFKDIKRQQAEEEEEEEEFEIEETATFMKRKLSRSSNSAFHKNIDSDKENLTWSDIKRIWSFTKDERKYFYWGVFGSIGNAIMAPIGHIVMSGSLNVLVHSNDPDYREAINIYCILQGVIGITTLIFYTLELGLFAKASETFIQTLRTQIFYKFLRNEIGWHDLPQNSAGSLTTSLEVDTANVGQLTGTSLGLIIQIFFTNLLAVVIAFVACWQMALIGMLIVPTVIFVAVRLVSNEAAGGEASEVKMKRADVIVSEVINNMKTVISLNAENKFLKEYATTIDEFQQSRLKTRMVNGLLEGGMYLILYSDLAGMYYLGSQLYFSLGLSPMRIFLAVFGLALTAFFTTQLFFLMPDTGKALHSVKIILNNLSRKSTIDIDDKRCNYKGKIQGNIEFRNVRFSYPTRPAKIFEDISFKMDAGKQIGITGPSGCGKSTIIQLLLRFYDVDSGEILIEGVNIQEYDLRYLRKKIGGVFQEPILFNESIEYNLKYANPEITDQDMIEACRKANALRFIQANATSEKEEEDDLTHSSGHGGPADPLAGFKRVVGAKGGQLSGGQKQRIAIARAILRRPKVLLLDEATSALDTQSEAVVQDALNKVSQGLTTICIAHRISTIKEMNEIIVLKGGAVIERGTFDDLVSKKGYFYELKEGHH